jgi:hypothetical protein
MIIRRSVFFVALIVVASQLLLAESAAKPVKRDAEAVEILARTVNAAGGLQALSVVHDLTESGEITFYWGKDIKGPVTIRILGGSRFRMDADLPDEKSIWVVKNSVGSKKEGEKTTAISSENAVNLGNLTYPVGHASAALADATTEVSFVGIEKREDRSAYRIRIKGRLGLVSGASPLGSVSKDLLIDALDFDILSVEDHPYRTYGMGGKPSDAASREIDFSDFRVVHGVRVPFSISMKLQGQQTLSIGLSQIAFNDNLSDKEFQAPK